MTAGDTDETGELSPPSVRSLVALLVLVFIGVAGLCVLYVATPVADRPNVWTAIRTAWPALLLVIPTGLSYIGIKAVGAETAKQSHTLNLIHKNTNGVLDKRIRDGVADVLDQRALVVAQPVVVSPADDAPREG